MKYLTPTEILFIHDKAIKHFGGSSGVRDTNLLESAAFRPQSSFDGDDLYVTIFEKAAALMHSLLKNHPFVDGNKRTAMISAGVFLRINEYRLQNTHEEELAFALSVEDDSVTLEEIAEWLKKHSLREH